VTRCRELEHAQGRARRQRSSCGLGALGSGYRRDVAGSAIRALGTAAEVADRALAPLGLLIDEIPRQRRTLAERGHRPWPLPQRDWLMAQSWLDLLFAHWAVPPSAIDRLLPWPLRAQVYDGSAWLGITPFVVSGLRLRGVPPLPWLSRFPELNVRTYVEVAGRPGIYFFSLDAARRTAVFVARRTYRLPYFHARMSSEWVGTHMRYESVRVDGSGPAARFRAEYRPSGGHADDPLARWLTERYCLYVLDDRGEVLRGEIHHPPWPLQRAEGQLSAAAMVVPLGLKLEGEPLLHFSARQDVLLWALARV
jgi:uncharacterized protein